MYDDLILNVTDENFNYTAQIEGMTGTEFLTQITSIMRVIGYCEQTIIDSFEDTLDSLKENAEMLKND